MRIGLNLIYAQPEVGGAWNYISNLISALGEYDNLNTYFAFVTKKISCIVPQKKNFQKIIINVNPIVRGGRVFYENAVLPFKVKKLNLSCMHWFSNVHPVYSPVPCIVSVYDLMVFKKPENFPLPKRVYIQSMMKLAACKAKALLPISEATANDIADILKPKTDRVSVIPAALNQQFKPSDLNRLREFRKKYQLPEKYFLYVAHTYPHKNHIRLLRAYSQAISISKNCWPLVFRGDSNVGGNSCAGNEIIENEIKRLGINEKVIRLKRVGYDEIPELYSSAGALVFPSTFEGMGMPVMESMACGCPVAASDLPVVREVAGESAIYFDPENVHSIKRAMISIQKDNNLRNKLHYSGIEQVKRFEAVDVVKKLINVYRHASSCNSRNEK